jgi:signal transduction histidine kinase
MTQSTFPQVEQSIARCRVVLSVVALVAVFIDPTQPLISQWIPITSGPFSIDPYTLAVMGTHLCYSVGIIFLLTLQAVPPGRLAAIATWADVLFGAAIAIVTEGVSSPFYAFFAFAVVEAGLRAGFRRTLVITAVSVGLYLSLIVFSTEGNNNFYIMRPVYLAITGYLVGYLGQQRLNLEAGIRELAAASQRQQIARDLHDGRAQALAGIALRLETCQQLMRRGSQAEALFELSDLQASVNREYDELRAYMRSLVGLDATSVPLGATPRTRFTISAQFDGTGALVEHVLHLLREAVTNVLRHAHASLAVIRVDTAGREVRIAVDDDGVGFRNGADAPWSMSSLVTDLGGAITVVRDHGPGAHLTITLPTSEG